MKELKKLVKLAKLKGFAWGYHSDPFGRWFAYSLPAEAGRHKYHCLALYRAAEKYKGKVMSGLERPLVSDYYILPGEKFIPSHWDEGIYF